jgi:hypothetical protein
VWYEAPAAGTDYVLVWFRLDCKKQGASLCRGHNFSVKLVDSEGDEWGEPTILRVENNLDPQEAIGGSGIEGWQVFEFPQGGALAAIRLYTPLGPSLYTLPPAP